MTRIVVIGHSHITALARAYRMPGHAVARAQTQMDFLMLNEPQFLPVLEAEALNPAIQVRVRAESFDLHVSLLGGNDHSIMGMVNHPQPFDFVLPQVPELAVDEACDILPAGLLQEELARRIAPHLKILKIYRDLVSGRLVHVESPPPIPSVHIVAYPRSLCEQITQLGVAPALLRYKLWRLHSGLYAQACSTLGVDFCPVPTEMQDADGMMIEAAWNHDPTHGNAIYGAAVIEKLSSLA